MFELLVEILHRDDSWTREPYANCRVMKHSQTGELARACKAVRFPTSEACHAQMQKLDTEWRAAFGSQEGPKAWVRWEMRCEASESPLTS